MSIMGSLYSGASGLSVYGSAMSVIGNNLANSNTLAYKSSRITFEDALSQTMGRTAATGKNQVGNGVDTAAINRNVEQGSVEPTSRSTDLTIDGRGYFVVVDYAVGNEGGTFFTRAGDFKIDKGNNLVSNKGHVLQGKELDLSGNAIGSVGDIDLGAFQTIPSETTSVVDLSVSLDASIDPMTSTYDPTDSSTYNFSSSTRVYDSLGTGHNVEVHFVKTANNTWEWHAVVESDDMIAAAQDTLGRKLTVVDDPDLDGTRSNLNAAPAGATYTHGTLEFTNTGSLQEEGSVPINFQWSNGTTQEILFNFGDAKGATGDSTNDFVNYQDQDDTAADYLTYTSKSIVADDDNSGTGGTVQYASGFTTITVVQDGFPAGYLSSLDVDADGKVHGTYTNGRVRGLYQLVLAAFDNEMALEKIGDNLYRETSTSGQPSIGLPNTGRTGAIISHGLEQSNVDMADEFVKMITIQRGFQANSRTISVTDNMLDELINLKR